MKIVFNFAQIKLKEKSNNILETVVQKKKKFRKEHNVPVTPDQK